MPDSIALEAIPVEVKAVLLIAVRVWKIRGYAERLVEHALRLGTSRSTPSWPCVDRISSAVRITSAKRAPVASAQFVDPPALLGR